MYVIQGKNSKPRIDFLTWKQQEVERAEAEYLERLRRRYLKSSDTGAPNSAKENLTVFYEKVFDGYTSQLQINPAVPDSMQLALHRDLLDFDRTAAKTLAEAADSNENAMDKTGESFVYSANRLSNILRSADRSFCDYIALSSYAGYSKYLFVSERADNSCMRCESLHGQMFTLDELAEKNVIPPLHPNCKCKLFSMDAAAEYVYNRNRNSFIRQLDRYCSEANLDDGGVYLLSHDALGGISAHTLNALLLSALPAITGDENSQPKWFDGIKAWAKKFWEDFSASVDAFFERGERLFANADETMDDNPLLGMVYWTDALSFGIVSGLYENWQHNYEIYSENPSVYNLANLYTHGLVEMVSGALFSDEPLSFQHVMDIIGTATLLYSAAKVVQRSGSSSLAEAAVGTVDDNLEDIARRNGEIIGTSSADDLNSYFVKTGGEAPYLSGTSVYTAELSKNTSFVRVYGGKSGSVGAWIMKADDIAGLTAEEIRDKFSLSQSNTLTEVCDVLVPQGTKLQISYAGPAFGGKGGGVQFKILGELDDSMFVNARPVQ